jgi:serpin B
MRLAYRTQFKGKTMKRIHLASATLLITVVVAGSATLLAAENSEEASVGAVVEGNTAFALRMYQELSSTEGNLFFSPYSISSALGMTYAGARNNTEKEMKEALHFPGGRDELCKSFGKLQEGLNTVQKAGDIKLSIANAIWAEKSYKFLPGFMDLVQKEYRSKISLADFVGNAETERKVINTWVEKQTNDKIKDLIPEDVLDALTRMVLVNAIYFKGDWASQFKENHTREREFNVTAEEEVQAKMMYQQGKFRLAADADTQALEMPYKGDRLSMLVLLPKQKNGISKLEKTFTAKKLNDLVTKLRETTVQVTFPKFKIETGYDLVPPFMKLGMKDAFSRRSDFSGMDGTKDLYISAIRHKAFVEVDEKGTEAAAATAVVMGLRSAPRHPRFNADHPFLFLIRDNATGSILFMGRVADPNKG